jgi:hypothetical protein
MKTFVVWTCASLGLFCLAFVIVTAINQPPPEPGTLAWAKEQTRKAEAAAKQQARELAALKALNDRQNAEGEARYQQQAKEVAQQAQEQKRSAAAAHDDWLFDHDREAWLRAHFSDEELREDRRKAAMAQEHLNEALRNLRGGCADDPSYAARNPMTCSQ